MTREEFRKYQENKFDAFCRVVIRNASFDNYRKRKRWEDRFSSLDEAYPSSFDMDDLEDPYAVYKRTYWVNEISIEISEKQLGEAMQYIIPEQRAVLLLSYFKDYKDMDIARLMKISHKTVAYRKKKAMEKLRALLEATDNGKKEN